MTGIELRRDRYVNMSTLLLYWHLLNATCSALCNEPGQDTSRELSRAGQGISPSAGDASGSSSNIILLSQTREKIFATIDCEELGVGVDWMGRRA